MSATPWKARVSVVAALLACAIGCGGEDPPPVGPFGSVVGGPCSAPAHCAERCLTSGSFPGGTCTVSCDYDEECPAGTWCIDTEGGVCLLACVVPGDCRVGYSCSNENRRGVSGDAFVCIQ